MPITPPPFRAETSYPEKEPSQPVRIVKKLGYLGLLAVSTGAAFAASAGMRGVYGVKQGADKLADAFVRLVEYDLEDSAMPIKFRRRKNEDD